MTAFACTDIQGSTGLWERMGSAFGPVLERHNAILRAAIAASGGREIGTEGDAFVVAFERATDAVKFAFAAQEALHAEPWPAETGGISVRIGVHVGEAMAATDASSGRTEWRGPALARAKAVASAAHGGQILISGAARASADGFAAAAFADLGEHRLRDAVSPERLWQAFPPSLPPRSFPPPRTLSALPTNLPAAATSFVGRAREKREVLDVLSKGAGLLTVSGPPGIGKTRLVLEAAGAALPHFRGGAWFVELTEAREAGDIAAAVARAMGITTGGAASAVSVVGAALELREPTLLVLDAFEHAVGFAQATVGEWRRRAPQVSVLVASCELLGLPGEQEFPLAPLDAAGPDPDALRLFVERAREADHRFTLSPENDADVRAIVAELEGIPLALELAAARLRIMKPAQLRQKLTQRFQLLRSTRTDLPANRRTLEGAVEWSWSLLADWEREAFSQLCVFRGGFFLDAAEAVLDLSVFPAAPMAMDAVQRLREKSFLRTEETPYETRFTMYRTIREFGEARLAGEAADAARERLAAWCDGYLGRWVAEFTGDLQAEAADRCELEAPNVVAAVQGRVSSGRALPAVALARRYYPVATRRGRTSPAVAMIESCLAAVPAGENPAARAWCCSALSTIVDQASIPGRDIALATEGVNLARRAGDPRQLAWALLQRCGLLRAHGDFAAAAGDIREASSAAHDAADPWTSCSARMAEASVLQHDGDLAGAAVILRDCADSARRRSDLAQLVMALDNLATCLTPLRDTAGALATIEEGLAAGRRLGHAGFIAHFSSRLGHSLAQDGRMPEALARLEEAERLLRGEGLRSDLALSLRLRGNVLRRMGRFPEALACYDEAEKHERALGHVVPLANILRGRGHLLMQVGDIDGAERAYSEARDIFARTGDRRAILGTFSDSANIAEARGDNAALLSLHEEGERLARELDSRPELASHLCGRAVLLANTGRASDGLALAEEADAALGAGGKPLERAGIATTRARILAVLRRDAEVRDAAREAIDLCRRGGSEIRMTVVSAGKLLAEALGRLGDAAGSRAAAAEALRVAGLLGLKEGDASSPVDLLKRLAEGATPASGT